MGENLVKQDEEQSDQVSQLIDPKNEHFKKYMEKLNLEIQRKMMPVPVNLNPIDSSISILQNIKTHVLKDTYQEVLWSASYIRALTLKARASRSLQNIWAPASENLQLDSEEAALSLESITDFLDKNWEEKLLDFSQNGKCFEVGQKLYESLLENAGHTLRQRAFQYLCKLQHCSYSTKMIQIIRRNLSPSHKLNSFLNLRENANLLPEKIKTTLSGDKIYGSFTKFPTYEECLSLMPRNSVYVVIQTNLNLTEVYCGILTNEKVEEEYQTNAKVFKKRLEKSELTAYWLLREKLNKIKKQIVYLACSDSKKLDKLLEDKQAQVDEIHQKFTKMSSWWLQVLVEILNRVKQAEVPVEVDKNKKGAKDTKKKAGKDQVAGYQSPLGASPAGFESITFLVDDFFEGFAFNLLPGLEVVPAISFDSSMFYLSRKMQSMNFRADANNSNGFGADKGKYVSFEFRDNAIGFKSISGELTKQFASLKMEGVSSSDRTPSIGDLKKYLHEPGYLQIYGSLDFLNHIRVPTLLESCGMAKVKLLMIADHLNYEKSLINKFIPLDNESQVNSIDEEMKLLKAVANLLDVSLIKNVWCMNKAQNQLLISEIYRNLGSGHYLGACLNSKQEKTPNQLLQKYMFRIYGCPVLRM